MSASSPANAATTPAVPSSPRDTAGGGIAAASCTATLASLPPPSLSDSSPLSAAAVGWPTASASAFPFSSPPPPPAGAPDVALAGSSPVAMPPAVAGITPAVFSLKTEFVVAVGAASPEAFPFAVVVLSPEPAGGGLQLPLPTPAGSALHRAGFFLACAAVLAALSTRSAIGVTIVESPPFGFTSSDPPWAWS